jgi:hypothetical protein
MGTDFRATTAVLAAATPRQVVNSALSFATRSIRLGQPIGRGPGLTPGQRVLLPLHLCLSQVESGGFHSLLASPTGDAAADMLAALRDIGAPKAHRLVAEAFSIFPKRQPPRSTPRREAILDELPEDAMYRRFDAIGRGLVPLIESEVYPQAVAFIRQHADDFLRETNLPSRRVMAELREILGKRVVVPNAAALAQLARLGVPEEILAFYRVLDWNTGLIEHCDARLRNLRGVLLLNRSGFRRIACRQGFVVIADTRAERNAFAVATSRQTHRPAGSILLFSSLPQLYRKSESAPGFAHSVAADFAGFLKGFLEGSLKTVEFCRLRFKGRTKPVWRPVK